MHAIDTAAQISGLQSQLEEPPDRCVLSAVGQFIQLKQTLDTWADCPKQLRQSLLPAEAVAHSAKAVPVDNRVRYWQVEAGRHSLLYGCARGLVDLSQPDGMQSHHGPVRHLAFHTAVHCRCLNSGPPGKLAGPDFLMHLC